MPGGFDGQRGRVVKDRTEIERAELTEEQKQAQKETEIADAVDPECLVAGIRGGFLQEPESDEQIAAQANAFPANEEQHVVRRENQGENEKHKKIEIEKKTAIYPAVPPLHAVIET